MKDKKLGIFSLTMIVVGLVVGMGIFRTSKDAAAAAHIEHGLALDARQAVDPVEPQRVDLVQRTELALGVPPAVGQVTELGQFLRIGIEVHGEMLTGCDAHKAQRQAKACRCRG